MSSMGILRKQPKQGKATDWISPAQMAPPVSPELAGQPVFGGQAMSGGLPTDMPPVPIRLRAMTPAGGAGWLDGALYLSPGSLLWQPDGGVSAQPVELASAAMVPVTDIGKRGPAYLAILVEVETPAGRFQLETDPELFQMSQQLVAEAAGRKDDLGGL
jgi:hypothetical protein